MTPSLLASACWKIWFTFGPPGATPGAEPPDWALTSPAGSSSAVATTATPIFFIQLSPEGALDALASSQVSLE